MKQIALLLLASSGCVALSHEQVLESDSNENGIPDSEEWLELAGSREKSMHSVAFADLDGDGFDELLLGNRSNSEEWGSPFRGGSVFIVYGRSARPASPIALAAAGAEIIGPQHETVGVDLGVGDFDCDGLDDVAVSFMGLSFDDDSGSVHVIYGDRTRLSGRPFVEDVAPALTGVLGHARGAGDIDADGCDDLLASSSAGTFLVRGRADRLEAGALPRDALLATDPTADESAGITHTSGDLDGDGQLDLIGGAYAGEDNLLRLRVFYGPLAPGVHASDSADATISVPAGLWDGVRSGFDFDADGRDELVVSSFDPGRAFIVSGSSMRLAGELAIADVASHAIENAEAGDHFGWSAAAGDADGDGRDDLVLGSHMFGAEGVPSGRVYRWSGPLAGDVSITDAETWQGRILPSPWRVRPELVGEVLGTAVAHDGDFDGDGFADALITTNFDARLVFGAARAAE